MKKIVGNSMHEPKAKVAIGINISCDDHSMVVAKGRKKLFI